MKFLFTLFLFLLPFTNVSVSGQISFTDYFEKKSLRIDFDLSGDQSYESAALRSLREEPVWGGPIHNLIDSFSYGGYYIHVYDKMSGQLIYSRGFNTLFEEWRATEQAVKEVQSWANSISVPYPKEPVILELSGRNKVTMDFSTLLSLEIEPTSIFIDRSPLMQNEVTSILYCGDSAVKVDLVFLAEGYTHQEQDKFKQDVSRFVQHLFLTSPFDTCKDDFNVWAVGLISEDSGTDISGEGIYKNTALNSGFYTFGVDRYLTTSDMQSIRDAVWNVPCDAIYILVNTDRYGGGGMYNFYAIGAADNERTQNIFIHEIGHSFAGLGDEYFSSEVAYDDFYNLNTEPWEANITTLVNFEQKWKDLLPDNFPIPTPLTDKYRHHTGVFEGAGYMQKGIYRPMDHCMMRDYAPFCPVCSRAILQMVSFLTGKN